MQGDLRLSHLFIVGRDTANKTAFTDSIEDKDAHSEHGKPPVDEEHNDNYAEAGPSSLEQIRAVHVSVVMQNLRLV